jgi:DNA invertase Pin-like site-specific DNA recombinase
MIKVSNRYKSEKGETMTNYAYLRVSTDQQDVDNQRHGILEYCNKHGINNLSFIEDTVSGRKKWRERKLGDLISSTMKKDDVLIVSEISRLARSTLQVLEILEETAEADKVIHVVKQNLVFQGEGDMSSRILATVLGMVAQIEREFISIRTKEALAVRKAQGMELGRPKGKAKHVKLDDKEDEIRNLIEKGVSKRAIAKIVDCAPSTLYDFLKRKKIKI